MEKASPLQGEKVIRDWTKSLGTEKRTKSQNLAFWMEQCNSKFWMEFGRKMGKWPPIAGKIAKIDYGRRNWWLYNVKFTTVVVFGAYSRHFQRLSPFLATISPVWMRLYHPILLPLLIVSWGDPPLPPPLSKPLGTGKRFVSSLSK